jgi:hypothetical protein
MMGHGPCAAMLKFFGIETFSSKHLPAKINDYVNALIDESPKNSTKTELVFGNPGSGKTYFLCSSPSSGSASSISQKCSYPYNLLVQNLHVAKRDLSNIMRLLLKILSIFSKAWQKELSQEIYTPWIKKYQRAGFYDREMD